jgi:hypothetical protein
MPRFKIDVPTTVLLTYCVIGLMLGSVWTAYDAHILYVDAHLQVREWVMGILHGATGWAKDYDLAKLVIGIFGAFPVAGGTMFWLDQKWTAQPSMSRNSAWYMTTLLWALYTAICLMVLPALPAISAFVLIGIAAIIRQACNQVVDHDYATTAIYITLAFVGCGTLFCILFSQALQSGGSVLAGVVFMTIIWLVCVKAADLPIIVNPPRTLGVADLVQK